MLKQVGMLWVSDITYLRIVSEFSYLSTITDTYSHKIVGYRLHPTLHAQGSIDALIMADKDERRTDKLIHHSDGGIQYYCNDYVQMIKHCNIQLSMPEKVDPYENPLQKE